MSVDRRMEREFRVYAVGGLPDIDAEALTVPLLSRQIAAAPAAAAIAAIEKAAPSRTALGTADRIQ